MTTDQRGARLHAFLLIALVVHPEGASASGEFDVIRPGREREVQALFSTVGQGESRGWSIPSITIDRDRIRARLVRLDGAAVTIELRRRVGRLGADAKTPSFEIFLVSHDRVDRQMARDLAAILGRSISMRDSGTFWGHSESAGAQPAENVAAAMVWMLGFLALLVLLAWVGARARPWVERESRIASIEVSLLVLFAFYVRWWVVESGPGNLYSRLPVPGEPLYDYPLFGPGFAAWMRLWFAWLGASDRTAFLSGAVAGALSVVPVYLLAWHASRRRLAGAIAGVALALWPIHAVHSATDEPFALITLLSALSLALVLGSERDGDRPRLLAGGLSAALAASVRPELALALPPLLVLSLLGPGSRRAQLRVASLLVTGLLIIASALAAWLPVARAATHFSPLSSLHPSELAKLAGLHGASVLGPPRTSWLLTLLFLGSIPWVWRALRWRFPALLLAGLLPAVPTAAIAGSDFITARYQLPVIPVAAAFIGVGLAGLISAELVRAALGRWRALVGSILGMSISGAIAWGVVRPPPEPTFRLEYRFFRRHVASIPPGCLLVAARWKGDVGLGVPTHLTRLMGLRNPWTRVAPDLDVRSQCVVYWRPATCRAHAPGAKTGPGWQQPDCALAESSYRLEPMVVGRLPARTGFCERYVDDPVTVGFYRLRPLRHHRCGCQSPAVGK